MERRAFIKSSVLLSTSGMLMTSKSFIAHSKASEFRYTERLSEQKLSLSKLDYPTSLVENPQQKIVKVRLKPRVARRYSNKTYILFESSNSIYMYDEDGRKISEIPLVVHVKDFAIDEKRQRIFVIGETTFTVYTLDFNGEILGSFGEFGVELKHQLSGIKSITCDKAGHIHILNTYSNNIKKFDSQGVYLMSYAPTSFTNRPKLLSIDGYDFIEVVGGKFADTVYKFDISGRFIG
ncbi:MULTISPECIES: hypothetical protein [Pseudoalteromonas]|uniref:6-bladed beta-propeller n=1 Tax=Pseudoalteromonas obscura TaxID=3048491 RepID=A0ABT7EMJ5_9GAMM|nr:MULTISPECIES: hypothetical protein [Pseudoalteromonas]MBQ4837789.1 hypothetical protein [Pseudoalteromonas luteoviolacea]MDK2596266.1 hypothetical protein [Pseudoalteromonas sp. P94(2023)]